jgi:hypothetical protein
VRGEQKTQEPRKPLRKNPNINIWVKNKNNINKLFQVMH